MFNLMGSQPGLRAVNLQKSRLLDRLSNQNPKLAEEIRSLKMNWYRIVNAEDIGDDEAADLEPGTAEVFVYDEIGGSFGTNVSDFISDLNSIDSPEIVVRINSPGGMLIDAIAMASAIAQHPSMITTRVDGVAASAASLVAIAGDRVEMNVGSQLMIHDVLCTVTGNAKDLKETIDWLNIQSVNVANMYANKSGADSEEMRALMLAETWMYAEEAVDLGLADSMYQRAKSGKIGPPQKEDGDAEPDEDDEEPSNDDSTPEEDDDDSGETDDEEGSADNLADVMNSLMHRKFRMTGRGFKFTSRDKAPAPKAYQLPDVDDYLALLEKRR